jgi:hypothetical protein
MIVPPVAAVIFSVILEIMLPAAGTTALLITSKQISKMYTPIGMLLAFREAVKPATDPDPPVT